MKKITAREWLQHAVEATGSPDPDHETYKFALKALSVDDAERAGGLSQSRRETGRANRALIAQYLEDGDTIEQVRRRIHTQTGVTLGKATVGRHVKALRK